MYRLARAFVLALCSFFILSQLAEVPVLKPPPTEAELEEARIFNADDAQWFGEDPEDSSLVTLLSVGQDDDGPFARLSIDGRDRLARQGQSLMDPCLTLQRFVEGGILLNHCGNFVLLTEDSPAEAQYSARRATESFGFSTPPQAEVIDRRRDPTINQLSHDYRRRLYDKPLSLLGQMEIEVRQDEFGDRQYFVFPGKDLRLFNRTPLQSGDQIVAINGVALSDREAVSDLYEHLRDVGHLTITLSRDEELKVLILGF